jgi:hypothetical protein
MTTCDECGQTVLVALEGKKTVLLDPAPEPRWLILSECTARVPGVTPLVTPIVARRLHVCAARQMRHQKIKKGNRT